MDEHEREQALKEKKEAESRPRYREFTVTPGMCGFKVKIGCSEAYFSSAADVKREIDSYLDDPSATERRIRGGDIRLITGPMAVPDCGMADTLTRDEVRTVREAIGSATGNTMAQAPMGYSR